MKKFREFFYAYFNREVGVERVNNQLHRLASKWVELLGEKEKKLKNGFPTICIKEGAEGELGPQVAAFAYIFDKLAYGDRSKYGKEKLDEFTSFAEMLLKFLQSTKANAEREFSKIKAEYSKNWWSRFDFWLLKNIMFRPMTVGWWCSVINTANDTIEEIKEAVAIIKERYDL